MSKLHPRSVIQPFAPRKIRLVASVDAMESDYYDSIETESPKESQSKIVSLEEKKLPSGCFWFFSIRGLKHKLKELLPTGVTREIETEASRILSGSDHYVAEGVKRNNKLRGQKAVKAAAIDAESIPPKYISCKRKKREQDQAGALPMVEESEPATTQRRDVKGGNGQSYRNDTGRLATQHKTI